MKIAISVSEKEKAEGVKSPYFRALAAAGAQSDELRLVTPADAASYRPDDFDGILFSGGKDVDPDLYGEKKKYDNVRVDRLRDEFELKWLGRALSQHLPVFAICRGAQLVNVKFGGTLYQDLKSDWVPEDENAPLLEHKQPGDRADLIHSVTVTDSDSRLAKVMQGSFRVNSLHHQGINRLGRGLRVCARAEDGLVEAVEAADEGPYMVAVQWHPEELTQYPEHKRLLEQFIDECRARMRQHGAGRA
jgi:putative glutamine amidotransferase